MNRFLSVHEFEELAFVNDMLRESDDTAVDGTDLPVTPWKNVPINTIFRVDGVKNCGETMILDLIDINERVYRTLAPYRAMGIKKNTYGWYYDYNLVNVS